MHILLCAFPSPTRSFSFFHVFSYYSVPMFGTICSYILLSLYSVFCRCGGCGRMIAKGEEPPWVTSLLLLSHPFILSNNLSCIFHNRCGGCGRMIAKGVRFNAEKSHVGDYHSTKIWSFVMRSPCCQHKIEIRTDPKNCDYAIAEGARRKVRGGNNRGGLAH
jgi:hypothetical protein